MSSLDPADRDRIAATISSLEHLGDALELK
jgi:hypothetical protein